MNQAISTLMQHEVFSVGPDDTIQAAEALMLTKGLSWVPVVEPGGVVLGVISSTDLLRFHADGKEASAVCAWQICTYKPITVRPDASVSEVARLMLETHIHHVVVADGTDIKGMVSSFDFVRTFMA